MRPFLASLSLRLLRRWQKREAIFWSLNRKCLASSYLQIVFFHQPWQPEPQLSTGDCNVAVAELLGGSSTAGGEHRAHQHGRNESEVLPCAEQGGCHRHTARGAGKGGVQSAKSSKSFCASARSDLSGFHRRRPAKYSAFSRKSLWAPRQTFRLSGLRRSDSVLTVCMCFAGNMDG